MHSLSHTFAHHTENWVMILPLVNHDLPENDGVLHKGEEHEEHAGQQPHLQGRHGVAHRDPRPLKFRDNNSHNPREMLNILQNSNNYI